MAQISTQCLVIGIGNEFRNDDGLGILIAREIRRRNLESVFVLEQSGEGTALMEAWEGPDRVIIVDAIVSGKAPGRFTGWMRFRRRLRAGFSTTRATVSAWRRR